MPVPVFSVGEVLTAGAMNQAGMWKITALTATTPSGTVTSSNGVVNFTTATEIRINSAFSNDFSNYLITASIRGSAASFARWRLRTGTSDASGINYFRAGFSTNYLAASLTPYNAGSETSWVPFCEYGSTANGFGYSQIIIYNPFVAATTGANTTINNTDAASIYTQALTHGLQVSYDGFTVLPNSGTMTGTIRVYGIRN